MMFRYQLDLLVASRSIDSGAENAMLLAYLVYEVAPGEPMDYKQYGAPGQEAEQLRQFGKLGYPFHSGYPYSLWPAFGSIGITFDH